jgi:hypothetical protein
LKEVDWLLLRSLRSFVHSKIAGKMKKILYSGLFLSVFLIALFSVRYHVAAFFVERYVQSISGGLLTYERSSFDKNIFTWEKPSLNGVHAEKAILSYQLNPLRFALDLNLIVDSPHVTLKPVEIDWESFLSTFDRKNFPFKTNLQIQMLNGDVAWGDERQAYFSFESAFGQHRQGGRLSLFFKNPAHDGYNTNSLVLHLFEQQCSIQIELDCRELSVADATLLASNILPSLRGLDVSQGVVQGALEVVLEKGGQMRTQGDLSVRNLTLHQRDWHVKYSCEEMRLEIDPTLNLEKAVQDDKVMQDFELESFLMGGNHSQKMKAPPIRSDYGSKDCVNLSSSTAVSRLKGKIEFLQPASIASDGHDGIDWELAQLTGGVFLNSSHFNLENAVQDALHITMEGLCKLPHKSSCLQLDGTMSLSANRFPILALGLKIDTSGDEKKRTDEKTTEIIITSIEEQSPSIEVALNHFSHHDFTFFQTILGAFWYEWKEIALRDGYLDAVIRADFCEKGISDLHIKNLHAKSLHLDFLPWKTSWKVENLKGGLSYHLLQTAAVPLVEVDATFNGAIKDVYPFVSDHLKKGLSSGLDSHEAAVSFHVTKGPEGVEIKGIAHLFEDEKKSLDQIEFGFSCASWPDWRFANGWFYAKDLPLEKYLSPFIIKENSGILTGLGEFKGTFDGQNILLHYDAQELALTNDYLAIEVPRVHSEEDLASANPLVAYHRFDIVNHTSEGILPIHQATYFEKNSGLLFTDIHTQIAFDGLVIHCKELEAFSNGVYLAGESTIDFSSPEPDVFTVDMTMPTVEGQVSQVRQLLSHFEESKTLAKVPLEGHVSFRGRGGSLHFNFFPGDYSWQGMAEGAVSEGSMRAEHVDLSLQDLALEFAYDYQQNLLAFEDMQGTLLVGKKERVDEYLVASDRLCFTDFKKREVDFDIWVGDKDRDFIRVAGSTKSRDKDTVEFLINHHLTHFGQAHPTSIELALKNWSEVTAFHLQTQIQLNAFLRDLRRFEQTGLLCLSRRLLQQLDQAQNASGDIDLRMNYDCDAASLAYHASGDNITFRDLHFDKFIMNGKKQDNTWVVDQFQLDDLSVAADLRCHHDDWTVHFLGLRYGKSLLLGLEGRYVDEGDYLDAQVNLLEVDLAELTEWDKLRPFASLFQAQGQLHGTGKMQIKLVSSLPWLQIETDLNANVRNLEFKGLKVTPTAPFRCSYSQEKGFAIKDLHAVIPIVNQELASNSIRVKVDIAEITHDPVNDRTAVEQLHFTLPSLQLGWLAQQLSLQFPGLVTPSIERLICESKKEGIFTGILTLNQQASYQLLRLELPKGVYSFNHNNYHLSDIKMEKESSNFRFSAKWHDEKLPFLVKGKAILDTLPGFAQGFLEFIDHPEQSKPLHVDWTYDVNGGIAIKKAAGAFFGLDFSLFNTEKAVQDEKSQDHYPWTTMHGDVSVDFQRALLLFSDEVAQKIQSWHVGNGYLFRGEWLIDQDHLSDILDYLHFQGVLLGQEFEAKGFQFHRLKASVDYSPNKIIIQNISAEDPAGALSSPELTLSKNGLDQWLLNAPSIHLENVRPSLLRDLDQKKAEKIKSLIFKEIKLENCQGYLADVTSLRAKGSLHFLNPPKKNIKNILFAIPGEILKRIGLDPSVLTPVTGVVFLEIQGDRIYLTKMKDVYSEGRASKFYLARRSEPSWIDFDGNLHAQIKMKQYNLLFKLAELFTVTVNGNIKKPVYSFQKQSQEPGGGS